LRKLLPGCTPWPRSAAEHYRSHGYWRGRALGTWLRESAARNPGNPAIVSGDVRLTYADLDHRCDRLADGLSRIGIRPRDRVVVQLPNLAEFAEVLFALTRVGAIPVLVMPSYRRQELRGITEIAEPVAYVIPDVYGGFDYRPQAHELLREVPALRHVLVVGEAERFVPLADIYGEREILPDPDPEEVALCVMSGGTTGSPKLVPRTHENYAYLPSACAAAGLDLGEVYLAALPLAHNFPLACPGLLGAVITGGTTVMSPTSSPDDAFPLIEREHVTWTTLVPTLAELWAQSSSWTAKDLSSLRLLQVGGAMLRPETAEHIEQTLHCTLQQVYGMAEGLLTMTAIDDPREMVLTTQGRPLCPADEVRIVDDAGADVELGSVGELWTRGPYTIRGYYGAAQKDAEAFTEDGHYRTGDLARRLPSGHLVISGRSKNVINRGGDKVPCEELEDHLLAHPGVDSAVAVPLPDPDLGERTCVFLVCRGDPPSLREIRAFLERRGVASFKFPDRLEHVDHLPLTKIGKFDRNALVAEATKTAGSP
jgi:2,3-dihydroxybenzoate-AMP ligase